jgi:hypothetical protein
LFYGTGFGVYVSSTVTIHPERLQHLQWCTLWFLKCWTHLSTV